MILFHERHIFLMDIGIGSVLEDYVYILQGHERIEVIVTEFRDGSEFGCRCFSAINALKSTGPYTMNSDCIRLCGT